MTLTPEALAELERCVQHCAWAEYREPAWRRGSFDARTGGGNFKRWIAA